MEKMIKTILDTMYRVLELEPEEMMELLDEDLLALHLIDSLSAVVMLHELEAALGIKIDLQRMEPKDISSIRRLAAALNEQMN